MKIGSGKFKCDHCGTKQMGREYGKEGYDGPVFYDAINTWLFLRQGIKRYHFERLGCLQAWAKNELEKQDKE